MEYSAQGENMKKLLSIAVLSAFAASPLAFAAEESAGGVINFSGAITDTTCTINGGKSADLSIALSPITVKDAGTAVGVIEKNKKAFSLTFSNCTGSGSGNLGLNFSSADNISNDGNYLMNTSVNESSTEAKNVGFALSADGVTALDLNAAFDTGIDNTVAATDDASTVTFYAHYYKTNALPAKAGALSSNVIYTVSYL